LVDRAFLIFSKGKSGLCSRNPEYKVVSYWALMRS
jgi:hypothetical protein